jgi:hypothetical protein
MANQATTNGASGPGSNMQTAHAAGTIILSALAALVVAGILFRKPARKLT